MPPLPSTRQPWIQVKALFEALADLSPQERELRLASADAEVKLLDFGIAEALDPLEGIDPQERNTTVGAVRPYIPNYASPEQVRGEPVSTATDIHSLDVLPYRLLTGVRPTGRAP